MSDQEQEQPRESSTDAVESGALEDEQQGKGYGEDEGERDQSFDDADE